MLARSPKFQCRNNASVAVCMLGLGFDRMQRGNIDYFWIKHFIEPLGGIPNVELFVHTSRSNLNSDSFQEIARKWPNAPELAIIDERWNFSTTYESQKAHCQKANNDSVFTQFNSFVLRIRRRECLARVEETERRCKHKYAWIARGRPDLYYDRNIFKQEAQTIATLSKDVVHTSGFAIDFGIQDLIAVAPRKLASGYFAPENPMCVQMNSTFECCRRSILEVTNLIYPECDLSMGILYRILNGSHPNQWTRYVSAELNHPIMVRGCRQSHPACKKDKWEPDEQGMWPLNSICEKDIPGSHKSCSKGNWWSNLGKGNW